MQYYKDIYSLLVQANNQVTDRGKQEEGY
jgi:hypothetical protein